MDNLEESIWNLRDEELIDWWIVRDELAEYIHQDGFINLEKVLSAFTEALNRLDENLKPKQ